jgi:CRP-like cAMP-binding protein
VDELFRIAGTGRQNRYEPGSVLGTEGQAPANIEFLLEGRAEARARDGAVGLLEPVSPIGLDEVLTGSPFPATLRASSRAVCLNLQVDEWATLLAENADLVQGLFKTVLHHAAFGRDCFVMEGGPEAAPEMSRLTNEGITPVEKVLALQKVAPFVQVAADDLLQLSNIMQRVTFTNGQKLQGAARTASVLVVVEGQLQLAANGGDPVAAGPGDVVGLLESLAGVPLGRDVVAVSEGILLRTTSEELLEILGERPGFLRQLLARLFGGKGVAPVATA